MEIKATPEEIAALVAALQERRNESYALVREPYQRHYSLVKVGTGRNRSFDKLAHQRNDGHRECGSSYG